ncbi:MAG: hypothetical protein IJS78_02635 [Clostridia bacterium]|nr:hypothetical protein [Clostridia bacterium]
MKQNDFLSAVGGIDEDLLEPVAESRANDKKNPVRLVILVGAVAAVVLLAASLSVSFGMRRPASPPVVPADETASGTETLAATEPIVVVGEDTDTDAENQTEPAPDKITTVGDNTEKDTENYTEPAPVPAPSEDGTEPAPSYAPVEDASSNEDPAPVTDPGPATEKQSEKTESDPVESDTPRQTETERQTQSGSSGGASMTTPDLLFTIYASSEIVRGTVVAEGVTRQTNPTGDAINGMGELIPWYAVISFYDLKVEEVFKGDVMPGNVIRIFSVALIGDPDDEVIPYRLNAGQTGIFCIVKDDIWTEPSEGTAYGIVESGRGVFDRVDGNGIYHSFVYDLDPADLPALIEAADEKWGPIYESYAKNPI